MMEHNDHIAFGDDRVSVRHRVCWGTLFNGRLILLILLRVAVSQGSTLVLRTTLHVDLGAKAAAEAGNSFIGIMEYVLAKDGFDRQNGIRKW
jgi:hypothetical protein